MLTTEHAALYAALCAPFDELGALPKGGQQFPYATTESVVSRLNEVLGFDGWSFRVLDSGRDADTIWVLGRLTVHLDGRAIVREQFGECDVSRGMGPGDARKGSASDSLKKCASLIGAGLYLHSKEDGRPAQNAPARPAPAARPAVTHATGAPLPPQAGHPPAVTPPGPTCEECSRELRTYRTPAGKTLAPAELATETMAVLGRVLCSACASRAVAK